jgi:hypothetical protein
MKGGAENGHVKHSEGNGTTPTEKKNFSNGNITNTTHFVERVTSIPLVKDGVSTAQAIANKTSLGRFALSKANATYTSVTNYATNSQSIQNYYTSYLQPQLEKVDTLGCKSLDIIQQKVPLINQPTTDIYQNVVKDPLDGVKNRLDSTISTVTHPAHVVIQETNKRLGIVVDNLEGAVDKYLPAAAEAETKTKDIKKEESSNNQVIRVYGVLNEASRRITSRVTEQVQKTGIPTSRDQVKNLAENNPIVQNVTQQLRILQETLVHSITVYGNAAQEHLPASVTTRIHQTTELFHQLTNSVQQQLNSLVEVLKHQPDWLKQKLNSAIESTYAQLELIKQEWKRQDINSVEKIKHVATNIQNQIVPLLEQVSSQLVAYSETVRQKAQHELNAPLHYFGLNHKLKTQ